jgi:phosphatidylserine decarboxylase
VFVALQYLLPHHLLCRLVYTLTRSETGWFKNLLIDAFVRGYAPEMQDAAEPDPRAYPSFNAFFTRPLRAGARPEDPDASAIVSPCDGAVSMAGRIRDHRLLQAKSREYTLEALLAGQADWTGRFAGGAFATLYLAPFNYHRVHMPLAGTLVAAWHVPGRLFSVNQQTAARVPGLFARNERVVCAFEGEHGPFAVILVGALLVGSMSTVWHGEVTPAQAAAGVRMLNPRTDTPLGQPRGAELGRFNMGSTVILLLPPGAGQWDQALEPGFTVRVGRRLGSLAP